MYWCYMLRNTSEEFKNHSYCGYTVNLKRRIRQHNGEIKGGAKATRKREGIENFGWEFMFLITGFKTNNNALSCEWKLKHPDGKRIKGKQYKGIDGRIKGINTVLKLEKWSNNCTILNSDCDYTVYVEEDVYKKLDLQNIPANIKINCVESLISIAESFSNDAVVE